MTDVRIYAACLASYNAGRLYGVWIDCEGKDADDLQTEVSAMLAASPEPDAEEWAIHDFECPSVLRSHFSESMGLDKVAEMAALSEMMERGEHYAAGVGMALDRMSGKWDAADVESWIDDHYAGESQDGPAGWAEQWLEDSGTLEAIPENLRSYFDFEAYARDCSMSDVDFVDSEGEILKADSREACFAFYNH